MPGGLAGGEGEVPSSADVDGGKLAIVRQRELENRLGCKFIQDDKCKKSAPLKRIVGPKLAI